MSEETPSHRTNPAGIRNALQLSRLMRTSEAMGLNGETRERLKILIQDSGLTVSTDSRPSSIPTGEDAIEMKIRGLVHDEAPWSRLEPLCRALLEMRSTPEVRARVVELALLHGTIQDASQLIRSFTSAGLNFYEHIHPAVRTELATKLWQANLGQELATILYKEREQPWLLGVERLFVFASMANAKDPTRPFMYYRGYRREIHEALAKFGVQVGFHAPAFFLMVGRMAIDLGYDAEARKALEHIRRDDAEYDRALELLLSVAVNKETAGRSHYAELLFAQKDWKERIKLLEGFLKTTRGLGGFRDRNRPALNELLKEPLQWIPKQPQAWQAMAQLLVSHRDLEALLPNLNMVFVEQAQVFLTTSLDGALWQPYGCLDSTDDDGYAGFWRGVARTHAYIASSGGASGALWDALEDISQAAVRARKPLPFNWQDLHKVMLHHVQSAAQISETDRERLVRELRIAKDPAEVSPKDIEDYLSKTPDASLRVLNHLETIIARKPHVDLELRLMLRRSSLSHLTNTDLNRIWRIAVESQDHDLAWRLCTILQARGALQQPVRHAWEISGEKRSEYPFILPEPTILEKCLWGFSQEESRMVAACLRIGPALPELLALSEQNTPTRNVKTIKPAAGSFEERVEKVLNGMGWLSGGKHHSTMLRSTAFEFPVFMNVIPGNPWSYLVARLADRLGINSWGWRLSRLSQHIEMASPKAAMRPDLKSYSGKIGRWLRNLSPEQRSAWHELSVLARRITDERGIDVLSSFICRLALLVLPSHLQALSSLQVMRAPVGLIWDVEQWLVSPAYSTVRSMTSTRSRVPIPSALQRVESIVKTAM